MNHAEAMYGLLSMVEPAAPSWLAQRWALLAICVALAALGLMLAWPLKREGRPIAMGMGIIALGQGGATSLALTPGASPWPELLIRSLHGLALLYWAWTIARKRPPSLQPVLAAALLAVGLLALGLPDLPSAMEGPIPRPQSGLPLLIFAGAFAWASALKGPFGHALRRGAVAQAVAQFVALFTSAQSPWALLSWAFVVLGDGAILWGLIEARAAWKAAPEEAVVALEGKLAALLTEQRALREAEARYRKMVEYCPTPIVVHVKGIIRYMNPEGVKLLGGEHPDQILGRSVMDFVHPDDQQHVMERIRTILETGEAAGLTEERFVRLDGSQIVGQVVGIPVEYEGEAASLVVVIDISELKMTMEQARARARELKVLLEALPDALVKVDEAGRICDARVDRTPLASCTLKGRAVPEVLKEAEVSDERVLQVVQAMERARQVGEASFDLPVSLPTGPKLFEIRVASIEGGGRQELMAVIRDVTELRETEEALRAYAHKLEQSNRELADFAFVASHDLQAPLRKIRAFGDLLEESCGDDIGQEGRDYLARMRQSADRLMRLVRDLLTLSQVSTDSRPFVRVELDQIAQEVVSDLELVIRESGGIVELDELPRVEADPLQMRQLLQNLISNALKFRRPGSPPRVKVSAEVRVEGEGDRLWVTLTITDNGIGFDEKYLDRIFRVFQRLHPPETYDGTGLGLAVCRRVVERHGGTLSARSVEGEGSTFVVHLPVTRPRAHTMEHGRRPWT